jgi:hypothetical protein
MERRDFLKLAGITGLSVGSAALLGRAWAEGDFEDPSNPGPQAAGEYTGPFFVFLQLTGGWDPTMCCDPKGGTINKSFAEGDIQTVGGIKFAPTAGVPEFFTAHGTKTMVLNGIDMSTNSHDAGRRHMASGRLGEGYPNLAALVAGASAPQYPMSFLTFGGYERTQGVVAPTRNGNQDRLSELAFPDRINPLDEMSALYHEPAAKEMILDARQARAMALQGQQRLPRYDAALDTLMTARLGSDQLQLLQEVLPAPDANGDFRKVQLMMAGRRAGICVSANIAIGGYDTHDDHDNRQGPRITQAMNLLNFIWEEAERQTVADNMVVVVGSDFGRTPNYNGDNGKDHWPVSSMMLMGAGVPGGTAIEASDGGHNPRMLDPSTLQPTDDVEVGVRLQPRHIHKAIRRLMGVEGTDFDALFPLTIDEDEDLDILA